MNNPITTTSLPAWQASALRESGLTLEYASTIEQLKPYVQQLISKSNQPHIKLFEHADSDSGGRFSSPEAIDNWMRIRRAAYLLINAETDDLAGMSWFRRESYPPNPSAPYDTTYGIRLFEGYTGKGLALPFLAEGHSTFNQSAPGHGLWLAANENNHRAIRLYENFGYAHGPRVDGLKYMTYDDARVV